VRELRGRIASKIAFPVGILCNSFRTLKRGNIAQITSNPLTIKLQLS
jgi:hypothetical protein